MQGLCSKVVLTWFSPALMLRFSPASLLGIISSSKSSRATHLIQNDNDGGMTFMIPSKIRLIRVCHITQDKKVVIIVERVKTWQRIGFAASNRCRRQPRFASLCSPSDDIKLKVWWNYKMIHWHAGELVSLRASFCDSYLIMSWNVSSEDCEKRNTDENEQRNSGGTLRQKFNISDIWHLTFHFWHSTFYILHSTIPDICPFFTLADFKA